uniref:Nuclear receptor domain-containing protein n=1 Tax=Panagrolaimus superbus TaxID=310955 RepID=A0A914Y3R1_9BILA
MNLKEKTCKVCERDMDETDEEFCDDCYDCFIGWFDSMTFTGCKKSRDCINGPAAELINCDQCRVKKCIKSGMKLPDFMMPPISAPSVQIRPEYLTSLMASLMSFNNPSLAQNNDQ